MKPRKKYFFRIDLRGSSTLVFFNTEQFLRREQNPQSKYFRANDIATLQDERKWLLPEGSELGIQTCLNDEH
jgi:hypothetical protein